MPADKYFVSYSRFKKRMSNTAPQMLQEKTTLLATVRHRKHVYFIIL